MSSGDVDVVLADDAIERLAAWADARRWSGALAVMDLNTREAVGARVSQTLRAEGIPVRDFVFRERAGLAAGIEQAEAVESRIRDGLWPVAIGSGVITDIVRYAADRCERNFVSVPTAASMDGYASGVAAMQVDGLKVTFPARAPVAIFADPRVLAAAPGDLTRAGIGDLLAKATARVDWLASHLLYGEPFAEAVAERVLGPLRFVAANAARLTGGDAGAARELLDGLLASGMAMAAVGSSRPASGCEHHASHFWDLLAAHGRREHASHGLQVGYATRFAMRLQRFAFEGGVAEVADPVAPSDPLGPEACAWLGEPTPDLIAAVEEKQRFVEDVPEGWPRASEAWSGVRAGLAGSVGLFDEVERALEAVGIPADFGYLGVDEEMLRATFRFASRLRARYTTIDFLEGQGALPEAIEAMLATA